MPLSIDIDPNSVSALKGGGYMLCGVLECFKRSRSGGYCPAHYQRLRYHGDATAGRPRNGEATKYLFAGLHHLGYDDPCPTWPYSLTPAGYPTIHVGRDHRLVCHIVLEMTGRGSRPDGMEACHSCNNGHLGCWHPHHLRWDTHAANVADAMAKPGGVNRGEDHGMAKLTEADVRAILADPRNNTQTARSFGVSREQVRDIRLGKFWRHVR